MAKKNSEPKKAASVEATGKDKAGEDSLTKMDETGRRQSKDRRSQTKAVSEERRKTARRRQIDPTTCERDYSEAEIEFMHALDDYKRRSGRMFPTCSEILEVLRNLGYQKLERVEDVNAPVILSETEIVAEVGINS